MIPVFGGDTCKECGSVDKLKDGSVARRFLASHPSGQKRFLPICVAFASQLLTDLGYIRDMPTPYRMSGLVPHLHRRRVSGP